MSIAETISKAFQDVKTVCTVQEAEKSPRTDGLSARRMDLWYGVNFLNLREAYGSGELTYSTGDLNISRIVDKLIRLTAKYTSDYASDIYYTLQELYKAVEETGEPLCQIISFRERGVLTKQAGFDAKGALFVYVPSMQQRDYFKYEAYQHWLLAVAPSADRNSVSIILTRCEPSAYHWDDVPETSEND